MENINLDKIIKPDELDCNMILSVPEEIGIKIQRIIQGNASLNEKNNTDIQIIENPSDKIDLEDFKYNDHMLPITILDMPCIIEAQKTIDYKTFYKTSDISQMMFVHDFPFKLNNEKEIENFSPFESGDAYFKKLIWKKDPDHKYKLKHGLTKCTKNIRERRFKAKTRYNQDEILDVAKKLKSIIDNGAANFENQMKNLQESNLDDESMTNKIIDNKSEIQSEINFSQTNNYKSNKIDKQQVKTNPNSNSNNIMNTQTCINQGINSYNFSDNFNNEYKNSDISNMNNNPLIKNNSSRKKAIKKSDKKPDHFEMPPSRKNMNLNVTNKSSNISLNLSEQKDERNKPLSDIKNKNSILIEKNNNLLILPLNEENPFGIGGENNDDEQSENNDEMINVNPELRSLKEEYDNLKEEYNKLKSYLEKNASIDKNELKDKERLKKKIKKRLKQIKDIFKQKLQR